MLQFNQGFLYKLILKFKALGNKEDTYKKYEHDDVNTANWERLTPFTWHEGRKNPERQWLELSTPYKAKTLDNLDSPTLAVMV